jgi:excisionase family DNA binding protein
MMIAANYQIELDEEQIDQLADIIVDKITARLSSLQPTPIPTPTTTGKPETLLSRKGLASELKVSLATIDRMMKAETIPFIRVGNGLRFRLGEVIAAMESAKSK